MKHISVLVPSNTVSNSSSSLQLRLGQAWSQLQRWWELAEQRRKLASLDDRMLRDLGLSRADVQRESKRSFRDDPLVLSYTTAANIQTRRNHAAMSR